ncbi:MAG: hypothetical protein HQL63_07765 [Magnetococcales bacterium]|nr:hypothetical protein [Magnetococcales bacterium]MBF0322461.1 hypothetical protein [Magnetococcales bacterium]
MSCPLAAAYYPESTNNFQFCAAAVGYLDHLDGCGEGAGWFARSVAVDDFLH